MSDSSEAASPKILSVKWGKMEVEGVGKGKDFKLWPGGGKSWDWSEHGTGHSQGIQAADCEELVKNGARVVVLSRGMYKRLKISDQAKGYLQENDVELIAEATKNAVKTYNSLVERKEKVGGLFHTTC